MSKRLDRANVQPKPGALQSKSSGIKTLLNTTAPPVVQPMSVVGVDDYVTIVQPNIVSQVKRLYPGGKLPNCSDGRYRD